MAERMRGVITPLLTPFEDDMSVAGDLYTSHAAACLGEGAHYLAPFGTTSEATSIAPRERMAALELLVERGAARPAQLMPGTGLNSLKETVTLSRHAVDLGCAAVMVLPPFFYVEAREEGLYRYFAQLIEAVAREALRICLYHIPQYTGVGISPALAARLGGAYPGIVVAYKDSGGDWAHTRAVIEAAPDLAVFPGSESFLVRAMRIGGAGCISAGCNSNVAAIRALWEDAAAGDWDAAAARGPAIDRHRAALQEAGLIPGLKALMAERSGDRRWLTLRPPLENADPALGPVIARSLG